MWKPKADLFGQFAKAVARRYGRTAGPLGGQVALYSLWNEPNLEHYLYPQRQRKSGVMVDVAARRYRELWQAGWKAIAAYDRPMRNKVLFGETAAISSPADTLYAALCLDEEGKPFQGRLRSLQGCSRASRLPDRRGGGAPLQPGRRRLGLLALVHARLAAPGLSPPTSHGHGPGRPERTHPRVARASTSPSSASSRARPIAS